MSVNTTKDVETAMPWILLMILLSIINNLCNIVNILLIDHQQSPSNIVNILLTKY